MPKSRGRDKAKRTRGPSPRRKPKRVTHIALHAISDSGDQTHIDHGINDMKEAFVDRFGDKLVGEFGQRIVLAAEAVSKFDDLGVAWESDVHKEETRQFLEEHPTGALLIVWRECKP